MKRTRLKRKSKSKNAKLKAKLWQVFSAYIKARDNYTCYTCGRRGVGGGIHAGHFVPKSVGGLALYFDERNVHAQCFNCNINLSGNQYLYGKKLGKKAEELYKLKGQITKWSDQDYEEKIKYYEHKITELSNRVQ